MWSCKTGPSHHREWIRPHRGRRSGNFAGRQALFNVYHCPKEMESLTNWRQSEAGLLLGVLQEIGKPFPVELIQTSANARFHSSDRLQYYVQRSSSNDGRRFRNGHFGLFSAVKRESWRLYNVRLSGR